MVIGIFVVYFCSFPQIYVYCNFDSARGIHFALFIVGLFQYWYSSFY